MIATTSPTIPASRSTTLLVSAGDTQSPCSVMSGLSETKVPSLGYTATSFSPSPASRLKVISVVSSIAAADA